MHIHLVLLSSWHSNMGLGTRENPHKIFHFYLDIRIINKQSPTDETNRSVGLQYDHENNKKSVDSDISLFKFHYF